MKAFIIFLSLLAAPMSQAQPKHAKPSSGEFMGVKFGVPISRQFPACPANGEYLPDNSRCLTIAGLPVGSAGKASKAAPSPSSGLMKK